MKSFGILTLFLTFLLGIVLLVLNFFSVIHANFKNTTSMLAFFQKARVYDNMSSIVRLEIQSYYPPLIQKNILLSGLADKLVDTIVTPDTVANVTAPAIRLSVRFAQAPTAIIDKKVVVKTALYKQQVVSALTQFGLPKFVVVNAKLVIDAVPSQLTLVNLEKRPNNILGIIIKIRTFLQYNEAALQISWMVCIALVIILFLDTIHRIRDFFKAIWISFAVSAVLVITLYFARNLIMGIFLPSSSDSLIVAQNALVMDAASYLLREIRNIGVIYAVFAVTAFVIWRFINFVKLQIKINKVLHKLNIHIPTVTVKVK